MHFTYKETPDREQLRQGDLIQRTDEVNKLLEATHPSFLGNPDNRYLMVLTQSCDLARRGGQPCKARHVKLAPVRPFEFVARHHSRQWEYDELERKLGFARDDRMPKFKQFLEHLLNNDEPDYFFLAREPELGLSEDHCAVLQSSIGLRLCQSYDLLLRAKLIQLTDSFQHKLGYLVGHNYSRVGTVDWETEGLTEPFTERIERTLSDPLGPTWVPKDVHSRVLRRLRGITPEEQTREKCIEVVEKEVLSRQERRQAAIKTIVAAGEQIGIDPADLAELSRLLEGDPDFRSAIK